MTRTEFIYYLMLNGAPKEKAEEIAKYFDFERPKGEWEEPTGIEKNLATAKRREGDEE